MKVMAPERWAAAAMRSASVAGAGVLMVSPTVAM
jgi:hypothetical protein